MARCLPVGNVHPQFSWAQLFKERNHYQVNKYWHNKICFPLDSKCYLLRNWAICHEKLSSPVPACPLVRIIAAPSLILLRASPRSLAPQTKGTVNLCLSMWCDSSAGVNTVGINKNISWTNNVTLINKIVLRTLAPLTCKCSLDLTQQEQSCNMQMVDLSLTLILDLTGRHRNEYFTHWKEGTRQMWCYMYM